MVVMMVGMITAGWGLTSTIAFIAAVAGLGGAVLGARVQHNLMLRNQHHEDLVQYVLDPWRETLRDHLINSSHNAINPYPTILSGDDAIKWQWMAQIQPEKILSNRGIRLALVNDAYEHWPELKVIQKSFLELQTKSTEHYASLAIYIQSALNEAEKTFDPQFNDRWRGRGCEVLELFCDLVINHSYKAGQFSHYPDGKRYQVSAAGRAIFETDSPHRSAWLRYRLEQVLHEASLSKKLSAGMDDGACLWKTMEGMKHLLERCIARKHFPRYCQDCSRTIFWRLSYGMLNRSRAPAATSDL